MSLDTSTAFAAAPSPAQDDAPPPSDAPEESAGLGALADLLAGSPAVSSTEAVSAGFAPASNALEESDIFAVETHADDLPGASEPDVPASAPPSIAGTAASEDVAPSGASPVSAAPSGVGTERDALRREPTHLADAVEPLAGSGALPEASVDADTTLRRPTDAGEPAVLAPAVLAPAVRVPAALAPAAEDGEEAEEAVAPSSTVARDLEGGSAAMPELAAAGDTADAPEGERRGARENAPGESPIGTSSGPATAAALDDVLLRSIAETPSVSSDSLSSDLAGAADLAAELHDEHPGTDVDGWSDRGSDPPFDAGVSDSVADTVSDSVGDSVRDTASREPDVAGEADPPARGPAEATAFCEPGAADPAHSHSAEGVEETGGTIPESQDAGAERLAVEHPGSRGGSTWEAASLHRAQEFGSHSSIARTDSNGAVVADAADDAVGAEDPATEDDAGADVRPHEVHVSASASRADAGEFEAFSSGRDGHGTRAHEAPAVVGVIALHGSDMPEPAARSSGIEGRGKPGEPSSNRTAEVPADHAETVLADVLLRDMAGASVSSDRADTPVSAAGIGAQADADAGGLTEAVSSLHNVEAAAPDDPGVEDGPGGRVVHAPRVEPAPRAVSAPCAADAVDPSEEDGRDSVRSDAAGESVQAEPKQPETNTPPVPADRSEGSAEPAGGSSPPPGSGAPEAEASVGPGHPDEAGLAVSREDGVGSDDAVQGDAAGAAVIHLPDLSRVPPSRGVAGDDKPLLQQIADVVAAAANGSAGEPAAGTVGSPDADAHEQDDAPAEGRTDAAASGGTVPGGTVPENALPEDTGVIVLPGPGQAESARAADERSDEPSHPPGASPLPDWAASAAGSSADREGPGEAGAAGATEFFARTDDAGDLEADGGSVIHLPDLSGLPHAAEVAEGDEAVLRQIADAVAASAGEAVERPETGSSGHDGAEAGSPAGSSGVAGEAAPEDALSDDAAVLPDPGESDATDGALEDGSGVGRDEHSPSLADDAETPGIVFDDTLLVDLAGVSPVSSRGGDAPGAAPAFDISLPDAGAAAPDPAGDGADGAYADISLEAAPPGPAAALAFATDPETEVALRDGLLGFGGASVGTDEAQVWQGGLRAAIPALAEGRSAPLVIVDIDGVPYPAGAIHELAAVCEVGTVVIAVGSDRSARPGRELLLAGVSDYLAKPLTAEAVRGVASRALADAAASRPGGLVASFVGCGGSGATTLATAAALHAAARGCYVSVLDLSRSVPAAALSLGVDPAAGLDQLLETADREEVEPESLEGVCARRSDRIEVYAHRWNPDHPAAASAAAVDRLLAVLRLRSQMVLVDGLDEAWMRCLPSDEVDTRVFVAEPTAGNTLHLGRMLTLLDGGGPLVFALNHTRAFRGDAGARVLRDAGLARDPDVAVPFDPALPETSDWAWPQGRLPRSLRKPVAALTDRLLGASSGAAAVSPATARAA